MTETTKFQVMLCEGTDMTGPRPVKFQEVRISANEEGLRLLRREISKVIRWARESPDYHTHFTGKDGPGFAMSPPSLVLSIERLGSDSHE